MTDQNPEDLEARFRLDQDEAQTEAQTRDQIAWANTVRDVETTLAQREALTRRVNAQASLMESLDTLTWVGVAALVVWGIVRGAQAVWG